MNEKPNASAAPAKRGRVIVYKGGESPSVAAVNQHGPKGANKADVNPSSSDAAEVFNKFQTRGGKEQIINPPFDFDVVADLGEKNSILPPLIQAMVVNIDGTGAEIIDNETAFDGEESEAGKETAKKERAAIKEYFDEPFPGESFLTQRRAMRNEQERIGNAYLEVMRNATGEVIFWKPITPAKNMRLVRLDEPVDVEKTVTRNGKEQKVTVPVRERRFVQAVGTDMVWFKEFGASRDVNRTTGEWAPQGDTLDFDLRGNEIIHFKNQSDPFSPYGLPRWWSNSPSVLGSRRAEEFNLLFFDSGGIPPMMLIVSGGALATEAEAALRDHFLATGITRHAAIVLEAYSTGGAVDNPSNVKIQVERFGSERQNDSMFEKYIENCDKRVQRSFRIPGQFIGMSEDFNFATALSSMMVAEAQVFACERGEFDEIVNLKLMPELPNGEKYLYRSKTMAMRDAERQIAGLELIQNKIPPKVLVERVGETIGMPDLTLTDEDIQALEDKETAERDAKARQPAFGEVPPGAEPIKPGKPGGKGKEPKDDKKKGEYLPGIVSMARDMAQVLQIGLARPEEIREFQNLRSKVETLDAGQRDQFRTLLTAHLLPVLEHDPEGAEELVAHALDVTTREVEGR